MRTAWILREYPFGGRAGQHRWLSSLLEASAREGFENHVLLPSGSGLPLRRPAHPDVTSINSPALFQLDRWTPLLRPRPAIARLAWITYKGAPASIQVPIAELRRLSRRVRQYDHVLGRDWSASEQSWIADSLAALRPEVVLCDSVFALPKLPYVNRLLILVHDLLFQRAQSLRKLGYVVVPTEVDEAWEVERLALADGLVAIQEDDESALRARLRAMPIVTAMPTFAPVRTTYSASQCVRCLIVASGAIHNVDGTRWLLAHVWPEISRAVPHAELHIVGTVGSQIRLTSPNIVRWGEVSDLSPHYEQAAVVFAPLRAGSGLKIKVVESICHGRATVTTTIGAEGLRSLSPSPLLVADTAKAFSSAAIQVLRDPELRYRLEHAANLAAHRFDPSLALLPFLDLVRTLRR